LAPEPIRREVSTLTARAASLSKLAPRPDARADSSRPRDADPQGTWWDGGNLPVALVAQSMVERLERT
jgi:hypothetical protein